LAAVPVLNQGVSRESTDNGLIVTAHVKRGTGLRAMFQPPVMEKRVELDELGAFVFRQIDGKRTTKDIIDAFMRKYRVNRREAELSCVDFLKSLLKRNVISVVVE